MVAGMDRAALRDLLLSRRRFLAACGAGSALGLAQDSQGSRPATRAVDSQDVAAAERLLGLSFSDAERELARARLAEQRRWFEALRARAVDWHTPPALRFDPWPTGRPLPEGPGATFEPLAAPPAFASRTLAEASGDLAFASIPEMHALLRARLVSSEELVHHALRRIAALDPTLLCVVTLLRDEALATARARDRELREGRDRGPLHGIPYGAKDLFFWPGAPTTFGAPPFADLRSDTKATVLARLEEAGAVLVAKLSLGALAMGDLWTKGRTRNPWNPQQGSSGSSAGSTAAVVAGIFPFALGSETLGSIVSPCVRCGATGLRPTFGAVSRHGAMPLSWSMDKVGPIARSALDCALVFDAIRGPDGHDPSVRAAAFPWRNGQDPRGLRIGLLEGSAGAVQPFLDWLAGQGMQTGTVRLPEFPYRALLLMLSAEAATAFDDLTRAGGVRALPGQAPNDWPNTFRSGRFLPAVEYLRAARVRSELVREVDAALSRYDAVVAAPYGGEILAATNLSGHPCVVLPLSAGETGAPRSFTLVGRLHGEAALLTLAEAWQRATRWHLRRPPLG